MGIGVDEREPDSIIGIQKSQSNNITEIEEKSERAGSSDIPSLREVSLSDFDFKEQGFVSSEIWTQSYILHARIIKFSASKVTCECVVNKEKRLFEPRTFPALLFNHLNVKKLFDPVIVCIKSRPGSTRIDIRDGKNIVDPDLFNLIDGWKILNKSGLDKPFKLSNDSSNV